MKTDVATPRLRGDALGNAQTQRAQLDTGHLTNPEPLSIKVHELLLKLAFFLPWFPAGMAS